MAARTSDSEQRGPSVTATTEALLLDEHFPPALARELRRAGFDVIGVAEDPALRGASDDVVYLAAVNQGRRVVTENVRDFRPLLAAARSGQARIAPLLLTTSKRYPRSGVGRLMTALSQWLENTEATRQAEEWL